MQNVHWQKPELRQEMNANGGHQLYALAKAARASLAAE